MVRGIHFCQSLNPLFVHKGIVSMATSKLSNSLHYGTCWTFLKLAYNGVNAAGPRFADLQIEVQRLGYDIARLCNESSVTIDCF